MGLRAFLLPLLLSLAPLGAAAQEAPARAEVRSPILTINEDRLLAETLFGQRMTRGISERAEALNAENERLQTELTREERSLTERRPGMEVEAFRAEADAFDARVQRIRDEQDAKLQALEASVGEGRRNFLSAVTPVLGRLMIERGAAAILERRQVLLSTSAIDVTDQAIAAIDAQLGEGPAAGATAVPEGSPDTPLLPDPAEPDDPSPPMVTPQEGGASIPPGGDDD